MTRPEALAGPSSRNWRPLKVSGVIPPFFSSDAGVSGFFSVFPCFCEGFSFRLSGVEVWEKNGVASAVTNAITVRRWNEFKRKLLARLLR